MRRVMICLLSACLLCAWSAVTLAAPAYKVTDMRTARMDALDLLMECAFESEYHDDGRNELVRWEEPLTVYVGGSPTKADREWMDRFFFELQARVPLFPGITYVSDPASANVTYYFVKLNQMKDYISNYVEGNWGYVSFWWNDYRLNRMEIGIATDVTNQKERNHLIMEEFINGTGLTNDHNRYADSIVYQPWTTVQEVSELDWIMLNMIYSPEAYAGMESERFYDAMYHKIR